MMNEVLKSLNRMNASIVLECHAKKCVKYDLREKNSCKLSQAKTTSHGLESVS